MPTGGWQPEDSYPAKKVEMIAAALGRNGRTEKLTSADGARTFVMQLPKRVTRRREAAALLHLHRPLLHPEIADHQFMIYIDARGMASLSFSEVGNHWHTVGKMTTRPVFDDGDNQMFWFSDCDGDEVPSDSMIGIEIAADAVVEFLDTGERPTCVGWRDVITGKTVGPD